MVGDCIADMKIQRHKYYICNVFYSKQQNMEQHSALS